MYKYFLRLFKIKTRKKKAFYDFRMDPEFGLDLRRICILICSGVALVASGRNFNHCVSRPETFSSPPPLAVRKPLIIDYKKTIPLKYEMDQKKKEVRFFEHGKRMMDPRFIVHYIFRVSPSKISKTTTKNLSPFVDIIEKTNVNKRMIVVPIQINLLGRSLERYISLFQDKDRDY